MKRQQRPRGATTRATIIDSALALVDQVGVEALSIRTLAKSVGAPPMSLYTHFRNKAQLLDMMYAEVAQRLYAAPGKLTWQAELSALCYQLRERLLEHPHWVPLLSRPVATTPPVRERLLAMMIADGLSPDRALQAVSSAALTAIGLTLLELTHRNGDGSSSYEQRFERLKQGDAHEGPATQAAFQEMQSFDLGQNFAVAISHLIMGLEAGSTAKPDAASIAARSC
jgi:AcrR family transcriptional regulator